MIRPSYGFSAFLDPGERLVERYVKRCSKIIIPDNPPPYTISEYSVGNVDNMGLNGKVEFVGSFVDTTLVEGSKQHIFAPISGPPGTRAKMLKTLLPVLEEIKTKCIISLGTPGKKVAVKVENCELHTWLSAEERAECMRNAKFVIFSGGHATCFETVKYSKPSICMPTQAEQLGNAAKLQDLNCSITVKNKKQLEKAVERIENEQESFDRNVLAFNKFSSKFKGLDRATEIVEALQD
jgi:UDP:flavonoid glycosyltransferase YjiC (YdhE family)